MSDAPRHPDHERVKARLHRAYDEARQPQWLDALAAEAIAMGAKAPDPREELCKHTNRYLTEWLQRRPSMYPAEIAREIVNYILDNAPK